MKKMLFVTLLSISFILGVTPIGHTGNPLPPFPETQPGEPEMQWGNYVGPDITGTLVFTEDSIRFVGSCKKIQLDNTVLSPIEIFNCASSEWLLGISCTLPCLCYGPQMFPDSLIPPDCYPEKKNVFFPIVYKVVHDYGQVENTKSFEIVGRFPTIIPVKK